MPKAMKKVLTVTLNPALDVTTETETVVHDDKLRCAAPTYDPGGGGINVARVLSRLGGDVEAFFPVGGPAGEFLVAALEKENVSFSAIWLEIQTRQNFSVFEKSRQSQYRFVMPGPELQENDWQRCLAELEPQLKNADYVVASGSLQPGVPEDFYLRMARIAKKRESKFILDTSGEPLKAALKEGVYLVKPNKREFNELIGKKLSSYDEMASEAQELIRQKKAEVFVISLAAEGALLVTAEDAEHLSPLSVEVKSAIGAGDSFVGGLTWGLQQDCSLEVSTLWGLAAAAATLLTPGTQLCEKSEVERLFKQYQALSS
jgi:6-phosphofructokinase 2